MDESKCEWEYCEGEHHVGCTDDFVNIGDTVANEGYRYCPFCGREIKEVAIEDDGDCPDDYPAFDANQLFG